MKLVIYYCSQCEMMILNGDTRIDAHVSGNHVPEVDGHRLVRVVSLHSLIPNVNRRWVGKTDDDAVMYEHRHKMQVRILLKALFCCLFVVLSVGQLIV